MKRQEAYRVTIEWIEEGTVTETVSATRPIEGNSDGSDTLGSAIGWALNAVAQWDAPDRWSVIQSIIGSVREPGIDESQIGEMLRRIALAADDWSANEDFGKCVTLTIDRERLTKPFPAKKSAGDQ